MGNLISKHFNRRPSNDQENNKDEVAEILPTAEQQNGIFQSISAMGLEERGQEPEFLKVVCIKDEESIVQIGSILKIIGINKHSTMADAARKILQEYKSAASMMKLSFVAEYGEAMEVYANQKTEIGTGKDISVEAATGFLTSALTYYIKDYIRAGFIRVLQNKKVICHIPIHSDDQVLDLKRRILEVTVIPIDEQRLRFDNFALINQQALSNYGIQAGDEIQLIQNKQMQIYLSKESGNLIQMEVENTTKISDLKKMIIKQEKIQDKVLNLYFSDKLLEDNKSIKEYSIQEEMIVQVKEKPVKQINPRPVVQVQVQPVEIMGISVQIDGMKKIDLKVTKTDTIESVKKKINQSEGIQIDQQWLAFNDHKLKDIKTLEQCRIKNDDVLQLTILSEGTMWIEVVIPGNMMIVLNVQNSDNVLSIKQRIDAKFDYPVDQQRLTYRGIQLKDQQTLLECDINNMSSLLLIYQHYFGQTIQIFVNAQTGKTITLNVGSRSLVRDIKEKILEQEGISIDQYKLIFEGKQLDDKRLLNNYGIQNLSTVNLEFPIRGGGGPITVYKVSQKETIPFGFSPFASKYRTPAPGLNLGSICTNRECEAFDKDQIVNLRFTDFDFHVDKAFCPYCHKQVVPHYPCFGYCICRAHFKGHNNVISVTPWCDISDEYRTYSPEALNDSDGETDEYKRIEIHTKSTGSNMIRVRNIKGKIVIVPIGITCALCHQSQSGNENDIVVMQCGHNFHRNCAKAWKARGLNCPHCEEEMADIK